MKSMNGPSVPQLSALSNDSLRPALENGGVPFYAALDYYQPSREVLGHREATTFHHSRFFNEGRRLIDVASSADRSIVTRRDAVPVLARDRCLKLPSWKVIDQHS